MNCLTGSTRSFREEFENTAVSSDQKYNMCLRMKWFGEDLKHSSSTILTGAAHTQDPQEETTSFAQNLFLQQTSGEKIASGE